jgi:pimeloyl-ACP methyl ester carboxylesterase
MECAKISAPLSWADPASGEIELALIRAVATGDPSARIGSLLTNPGGPGGSGISFLEAAYSEFSDSLQASFDIVSFDPRGVGASTPIVCDQALHDPLLEHAGKDTSEGRAESRAIFAEWGRRCLELTGELFNQVDTQSVARDLDMMRHVLGDEKLNYLGISYGTQIGAVYAGLFPENVGKMVLDGAVDPTLTADESSIGQAQGFERALTSFVQDCLEGSSCPLSGTVSDGLKQIRDLYDSVWDSPLPTGTDRPLGPGLFASGLVMPLYTIEYWPYLEMAFTEAFELGTGELFLQMADVMNDRNADGTFMSNSTEAFYAVGCLDNRGAADDAGLFASNNKIWEVAPTLGDLFLNGGLVCAEWPNSVVNWDGFNFAAAGAPPIIVIGTTRDPATPFEWAESLANLLDSGVLLVREGDGHAAFGSGNTCIDLAVDQYFINSLVPADGTRC